MRRLIDTIKNIWGIEDLRNRILTTIGILAIYRLGSFVVIKAKSCTLHFS